MGTLEQILAQVDAAKRAVGRNVSDLITDPALYAEKVIGHLRNQNAGVTPTIANGELTNRMLSPSERVQHAMETLDFGGGLGVIKPKGGNWLSGRYGPEAQLKGLRRLEAPYTHINEQGFTVAPEYGRPMTPEELAAHAGDPATFTNNKAINSFVDRQLTKYVKNDMASPADPIRKLADAWPAEKAEKLAVAEARVQALRQKQQAQAATRGVPEEYLTQTRQDVLKAEEARDLIAENEGTHLQQIGRYDQNPSEFLKLLRKEQGMPAENTAASPHAQVWESLADTQVLPNRVKDFQLSNNIKQDPWLAKANPDTPVYALDSAAAPELGFSHLVDELHNSLREGRLTPEQLGKMPIDQAVRHVAEINALRKVTANKALAMDMKDIPLHKDYPEQGYSWRQLKAPEVTPELAAKLEQEFPEDVAQLGHQAVANRKLQKWLTQEGDAMGHCVGGYCPDVMEGRSSIYSLRDAKGQPHVTIETTGPFDTQGYDAEGLGIPRIVQIKGKGNAKPKDEYLPFVQDFVRSGKWGDIGDAANTGLTPEEIQQLLKGQ